MRIRSVAALALLPVLALACGGSSPPDGAALGAQSDAIYKGSAETSSPAVMALQIDLGNSTGAACTGTVVAVKGNVGYFLTAAHCAVTHDANDEPTTTPLDPSQLFVLPGTDYSKATTGYPVLEVKVHPAYKAVTSAPYDFAMMRFSFNGAAPPVIPPLTPAEDTIAVGSKLDVIGYGKTDSNPNNSVRNHAQLTVSSLQASGTLVIFDPAQNVSGTCQGDSGGPGLTGSGSSRRVGAVTSFGGQSCGNFGGSGRVSKVYDSFIKPFIDGTTGALTCDECRTSATVAGGACSGQVDACLADTDCAAFVDCANKCADGDDACQTKCQSDHAAGVDVYVKIFDCVCATGCVTECAADALCKKPSCGFTAQDPTCQTCFETKCCSQMAACAADKDCAACATSANKPASCATNALYQAEQQCISTGCLTECGGSKCGFGSDDATCNTCYEEKCCSELAACAADATCTSCVTTSTPAASCASNPLVKAARTCVNGSCATACGGGAGGSGGSGAGGSGAGGSSAGGSSAGGATSAGSAGASAGGTTSAGGATAVGGASAAGSTSSTAGAGGGDPAGGPAVSGADDSSSSGGCAVGATPSGAGSFAPLALLGLATLARRRRAR